MYINPLPGTSWRRLCLSSLAASAAVFCLCRVSPVSHVCYPRQGKMKPVLGMPCAERLLSLRTQTPFKSSTQSFVLLLQPHAPLCARCSRHVFISRACMAIEGQGEGKGCSAGRAVGLRCYLCRRNRDREGVCSPLFQPTVTRSSNSTYTPFELHHQRAREREERRSYPQRTTAAMAVRSETKEEREKEREGEREGRSTSRGPFVFPLCHIKKRERDIEI